MTCPKAEWAHDVGANAGIIPRLSFKCPFIQFKKLLPADIHMNFKIAFPECNKCEFREHLAEIPSNRKPRSWSDGNDQFSEVRKHMVDLALKFKGSIRHRRLRKRKCDK